MEERMTDPRDLPGLQEGIAEVLADVTAEMEHERPGHRTASTAPPSAASATSRARMSRSRIEPTFISISRADR